MPNTRTDIEPVDQRFTVSHARSLFLEAIRTDAPEVLESLSKIGLPEPFALCAKSRVLAAWANQWHINADWVLEAACETLLGFKAFPHYLEDSVEFSVNDIWRKRDELSLPQELLEVLEVKQRRKGAKLRLPESSLLLEKFRQARISDRKIARELFWNPVSVGWQVAVQDLKLPATPKGLRRWEADSEPRKFYLEEAESIIAKAIESSIFADLPANIKFGVKQAKLEQVEKYCDEVVRKYRDLKDEQGNRLWVETREKANLKRNAQWAVKFQVLGQDFSEIARDENVFDTTVSRGVENFLKLVRITTRKPLRGRRRGSKNSILTKLGN